MMDPARIDRLQSDPYTKLSLLGHGAYSTVDKVKERHGPRVFARKTHLSRATGDAAQALANEVSTMRRLQHHHIPRIHQAYILQHGPTARDAEYAFVMEQVAQCDLQDALEQPLTPQSNATLRRCFGCLAVTVAFLHNRNQFVRHKDIKPGNILLWNGMVLLTDFGLAHDAFAKGLEGLTTHEHMDGTRRFWPPECDNPHAAHSAKGDVFSLGCVFFELLVKVYRLPSDQPFLTAKHRYCQVIPQIQDFLNKASQRAISGDPSQARLLKLCSTMMDLNSAGRPLAAEVEETIRAMPSHSHYFCATCLGQRPIQLPPAVSPHGAASRVPPQSQAVRRNNSVGEDSEDDCDSDHDDSKSQDSKYATSEHPVLPRARTVPSHNNTQSPAARSTSHADSPGTRPAPSSSTPRQPPLSTAAVRQAVAALMSRGMTQEQAMQALRQSMQPQTVQSRPDAQRAEPSEDEDTSEDTSEDSDEDESPGVPPVTQVLRIAVSQPERKRR